MQFMDLNGFKSQNGYEIDGTWYPRVTAIVSIKAKPALYKFYADQPSFAHAEAMKDKSAQEGTLVHETIEGLMAGKQVMVSPAVQPIVTAFYDFRNQNVINPLEIESKIMSKKHGYAGTIDVLAEVNGKVGVLDIKTSVAIYRDYGIQTAAYVEALHEKPTMPRLTRWILRLDQNRKCLNRCGANLREKGGTEKIRNGGTRAALACKGHVWGDMTGEVELKELGDLEHDTQAFLAAKKLWEWENHEWIQKIKKTSRYVTSDNSPQVSTLPL